MKYFEVEKEILTGMIKRGKYDGDFYTAEAYNVKDFELCLGFNVNELDEAGRTEQVRFYPVQTNTADFSDNREKVLDQIRQDYSPDNGWQNNDW